MVSTNDRRLIEDYLPIEAISGESAREKRHISGMHLWWARRPLVACRAAVFGALVPEDHFGPTAAAKTRMVASEFVAALCRQPVAPRVVADARSHILAAQATRLTSESAEHFTPDGISSDRTTHPKVLDMFAGGGAIPLEALRLGCDAYALELNPVAHIVEICTLVYPQKYGAPDPTATGTKDGTWAGLAAEIRHWAKWVLDRAKLELADLYPPIPDSVAPSIRQSLGNAQLAMADPGFERGGQLDLAIETPAGYLTPVAYLWTRTARCRNPSCGAVVPLVRQTWLSKKDGHFVALKPRAISDTKRVHFEVAEAPTSAGLRFDPTAHSVAGNATCLFCGTVADSQYVRSEGELGGIGHQLMACVCARAGHRDRIFLSATAPGLMEPSGVDLERRIAIILERYRLTVPDEPINPLRPSPNARGLSAITRYGMTTFSALFTLRQMAALLTFAGIIRSAPEAMAGQNYEPDRVKAVTTYLGLILDKVVDYNSALCSWHSGNEQIRNTFGRHALPMVWDFAETNPLAEASGSWRSMVDSTVRAISPCQEANSRPAIVQRGTATNLPWPDSTFDAVITDPPYYDNIPYAEVSDFFYVWLKRSIGDLFPDHFGAELTPKKAEATAIASRFGGDMAKATMDYEKSMLQAFLEAFRVLKSNGLIVVVYAHKTTLGWATLVDAMRLAGFTVTEAWPLDTEMGARLVAKESASLASSIFLVARKRLDARTGSYEDEVQPELDSIVRERVEALWQMGVSGADLVIAAVGAGLRAFTRFERVEYANGEEVPAQRFLAEVEGVVLETLLEKIFGVSRSGVSAVDGPSRFYVLWRFTYKAAELDAGEAIVFTYSQPVELDGPQGLSTGSRALVQKKQAKYRLLDFTERGGNDKLGLPDRNGQPAPLIDVLHRILWLMEHEPRSLPRYLDEARPEPERLRLLAQALAGAGLKGKSEEEARAFVSTTGPEQAALARVTANWRSLIEQQLPTTYGPLFAAAE